MKVTKQFKIGLAVSVLLLTISACGKGTTVTPLPGGIYGSCGTMAGTNVYTGNIVSCEDVGQCNPYDTVMDGTLTLSVMATSGLTSGQATITGSLKINNSEFCCTSQGLSYVSMPNAIASQNGAKYILDGITLLCQPVNTGYYQSMTLRVGVGVYAPYSMITTDQRFVGDFEIVSGVNFGGTTNSLYFFAE